MSDDVIELEDWQETAKKELEKELNIETEVKPYDYFNNLNGFYLVSTSGEANNEESEWIIFRNEDSAEQAALSVVRDDLEEEPGLFNPDWISNHLDEDRTREFAEEDSEQYYNDIETESDDDYGNRLIAELVSEGYLDVEDIKDDEKIESAKQNAIGSMTDDKMSGGSLGYFEEIYGKGSEAIEAAIKAVGIDIDAAAEDAVDIDGTAHFLDKYDGCEVVLPSGAVAYGVN